jgi:peptide deformylase
MALRTVISAPDPRLKVKSAPVEVVDSSVRDLIDDMLETMYAAPGIGLAAIQIGVPKRVIVVDITPEGEPQRPLCMINPEVLWRSDDLAKYEEGCLSLPDYYAEVERPARVKIRYLNEEGETVEREVEGLLATCIQHEIDHLEGTLFVDHISTVRRSIILRKLAKAKKAKLQATA